MNEAVAKWIDSLSADHRKLLLELRQMILKADTEIQEDFKWSQPCYSRKKLFCYLQKSKEHVSIGFQQGAHLRDPDALLKGEGKDMRHIKLALNAAPPVLQIEALIKEAIAFDAKFEV